MRKKEIRKVIIGKLLKGTISLYELEERNHSGGIFNSLGHYVTERYLLTEKTVNNHIDLIRNCRYWISDIR